MKSDSLHELKIEFIWIANSTIEHKDMTGPKACDLKLYKLGAKGRREGKEGHPENHKSAREI